MTRQIGHRTTVIALLTVDPFLKGLPETRKPRVSWKLRPPCKSWGCLYWVLACYHGYTKTAQALLTCFRESNGRINFILTSQAGAVHWSTTSFYSLQYILRNKIEAFVYKLEGKSKSISSKICTFALEEYAWGMNFGLSSESVYIGLAESESTCSLSPFVMKKLTFLYHFLISRHPE